MVLTICFLLISTVCLLFISTEGYRKDKAAQKVRFREVEEAKVKKARMEIHALKVALMYYSLDAGKYPTTEQGLEALWSVPNPALPAWNGPYLQKPLTNDPWGNPYVYRMPGTHYGYDYDLLSYGKDGKHGGNDLDADITNWNTTK